MEPLPTVVATGDRRASLEALRDAVAASLVAAEPENVAALAKELRAVMKELADLPAPEEASTLDDLAAARAARQSDAKIAQRPGAGLVGGQGGG